jgi:hypothetical protein
MTTEKIKPFAQSFKDSCFKISQLNFSISKYQETGSSNCKEALVTHKERDDLRNEMVLTASREILATTHEKRLELINEIKFANNSLYSTAFKGYNLDTNILVEEILLKALEINENKNTKDPNTTNTNNT